MTSETDEQFVEKIKLWIYGGPGTIEDKHRIFGLVSRGAEAADTIATLRDEVLEEAARVADALEDALSDEWRKGLKCDSHLEGKSDGAGEVAAAIRALSQEKSNG